MADRFEGWDIQRLRDCLRRRAAILHKDGRVKVRFDESDLVNETFARAAETASFPDDLTTFEKQLAWLYVVQSNRMIDMVRHETRQADDVRREQSEAALLQALDESSVAAGGQMPSPDPGPDEQAAQRELLERALATMTPQERDIVRLKQMDGRTFREIADHTGLDLSKVTRLYYGALGRAKEQLEE